MSWNNRVKKRRCHISRPDPVNLILMGFGNVGRAFLQVADEKKELCLKRYGLNLRFIAIFEINGGLFSPASLNTSEFLEKSASQLGEHPCWRPGLKLKQVLEEVKPGVLVECTPSNIKTGEPGLSHLRQALSKGWNAAVANKGPLVFDFKGLKQVAQKNRASLKFSGATAAALPTLDVGLFSLAGAQILGIEGILNGTSNYILTRMEEGISYEEALREAQAKGIAERDPSLDVEGWDTASKILLIVNEVMEKDFVLKDVKVEGITRIPSEFLHQARKEGKALKLLGKLRKEGNELRIEVALSFIDHSHPLFGVSGTNKGIAFFTDTMGAVTVTGGKSDPRGAAASLLKDIINIYRMNKEEPPNM